MNPWQEQVRQFHQIVCGAPTSPAVPMLRNPMLRASLIIEEALETAFALVGPAIAQNIVHRQSLDIVQKWASRDGKPDLIEAIDGLCDTVVVCLGTAEDIGVDLDSFFTEVMRSNLAKAGGAVDTMGKKQKPPGWTPPDLAGALRRTLAERAEAAR
jgi:predicted HAD superfamily Cof-like phosphohydrolase